MSQKRAFFSAGQNIAAAVKLRKVSSWEKKILLKIDTYIKRVKFREQFTGSKSLWLFYNGLDGFWDKPS